MSNSFLTPKNSFLPSGRPHKHYSNKGGKILKTYKSLKNKQKDLHFCAFLCG